VDVLIDIWNVTFVTLLGLCGCVGILALTSPKAFATVASYGDRNVFQGVQTSVDRRFLDIDTYLIAHGRLFGVVVVATVGGLWMISRHGPEVYSKSFLLIVVTIAMLMGFGALCHIMRQSRRIEVHLAEAHTDPLTGLANRRTFDTELSRRIAQRQRQGTPLCLMIMDIDKFKHFNDQFGHALGDTILKEVSRTLQATARHMDIVARLGGDEFAVLLPDSTLEEASHGAERMRSAIGSSPIRYEGREYTLTVSIGLADAQVDDDAASLLKRADSALYAAKEAGRNCSYRYGGPEPAAPTPC
jgi:diguanylate cyclase (GGDEF)-like protein